MHCFRGRNLYTPILLQNSFSKVEFYFTELKERKELKMIILARYIPLAD